MNKIKHIFKSFLVILILFFVTSVNIYNISAEDVVDNPYYKLFEIQFNEIKNIYKNQSVPGFTLFVQAKENSTQFPYNSFINLINCYSFFLLHKIQLLTKEIDNKSISDKIMIEVQNNLLNISNKKTSIVPLTIASAEWLSLADQKIIDIEEILFESNNTYARGEYQKVIHQLILANSLLQKTKILLNLSDIRNNIDPIESVRIEQTFKIVAYKWINMLELKIDHSLFLTTIPIQSIKILLNQSYEYYENAFYYKSLMKTAEAKAMLEYYNNLPALNNRTTSLKSCEAVIEYVNLTLSKIYNKPTIDAPIAQYNIELANLHLRDAKNEKTEGGSILLAGLSIQEALIAKNQAQSVIDVFNLMEKGFSGIDENDRSISTECERKFQFDSNKIQYLMLMIIVIQSLLLFYIFKKKNFKDKN